MTSSQHEEDVRAACSAIDSFLEANSELVACLMELDEGGRIEAFQRMAILCEGATVAAVQDGGPAWVAEVLAETVEAERDQEAQDQEDERMAKEEDQQRAERGRGTE